MTVLAAFLPFTVAAAFVAVHLLRADQGVHANRDRLNLWSATAIVRDFATDVVWGAWMRRRPPPSKDDLFALTLRREGVAPAVAVGSAPQVAPLLSLAVELDRTGAAA